MKQTNHLAPATTRGSRQAIATRESVLDTAEQLFLEKGFRATSLQEIADKAGRTTGSIYSSFKGKDDLFLEIYRRRVRQQEKVWRAALAEIGPSTDAATAIGTAVQLALPDPAWHAVQYEFVSFAARHPELGAEIADVYHRASEILSEILAESIESPGIPVDRLAAILLSLARGFALTWFVNPAETDPTLFSDAAALLLGTPIPPAALFLNEFVAGIPWAHIDIAGTMQSERDDAWRPAGATGFGTRLLIDLLLDFAPVK